MVATVRISRGDRKNRRITSSSTAAPSTTAADDPGHERDDPARAAGHDEQHRERRRRRAEVALGEVEDAVRPVHEGEPEREEGAQAAEDRALHHDPRRRPPQQLYDHEEGDRPEDPGERAPGPT